MKTSEQKNETTAVGKMELLAPAGSWDALLAGLAGGADAIYLGGKLFNARQSAANFDLEELKEATDLLHLHGKKIHVTVNTLLSDDELQPALDYLTELYNIGVDAVIIQDLGLIKLARTYLPELNLHASTQMTIHNAAAARLLSDHGFNRVVLAREMTADEAKTINAASPAEVEVFVHGALCVCYSGQCLMSSIIGGRSGNRGRCAQPCRMEYKLFENGEQLSTQGNYLLSPKDLALLPIIPKLAAAGVASLKIEGRMKRPEYVYNVVKTYREALDAYYASPNNYRVETAWIQKLEQSFNRGFSTGYFDALRNLELMNFKRPNNRGIQLGRVKSVATGNLTLRLDSPLDLGDEVEVWVSCGGRAVTTIEQLKIGNTAVTSAVDGDIVTFNFDGKAFVGDRVFKVYSAKASEQTAQVISDENMQLKFPCTADVCGRANEPLELKLRDEQGHEVLVYSQSPLQIAKNRPLTAEVLTEQLGRLGNTNFYLKELLFNLPDNLMLPLSVLNQLRRDAITELNKILLQDFHRPLRSTQKIKPLRSAERKGQARLSAFVADLNSLEKALFSGIRMIYVGGDEFGEFHWSYENLAAAVKIVHEASAQLILALPRINRDPHWRVVSEYAELAEKLAVDGVLISDLGAYEYFHDKTDLPLYLNYTMNIFNAHSSGFFDESRLAQITLSPELTLNQIAEITRKTTVSLETLIQGPLELMVSEYCPINATSGLSADKCDHRCRRNQYFLRDRMNVDFPIVTDRFCHMHLLNSKDLCLYGDLERLYREIPMTWRLELRADSTAAVKNITGYYQQALKTLQSGQRLNNGDKIMEQIKELTGKGITKGHFFRGVIERT